MATVNRILNKSKRHYCYHLIKCSNTDQLSSKRLKCLLVLLWSKGMTLVSPGHNPPTSTQPTYSMCVCFLFFQKRFFQRFAMTAIYIIFLSVAVYLRPGDNLMGPVDALSIVSFTLFTGVSRLGTTRRAGRMSRAPVSHFGELRGFGCTVLNTGRVKAMTLKIILVAS